MTPHGQGIWALGHSTAEGVGIHVAGRGARHEALEPQREGVRENFSAFDECAASVHSSATSADRNS